MKSNPNDAEVKRNLIELLKIYTPSGVDDSGLITFDGRIKAETDKLNSKLDNSNLATKIQEILKKLDLDNPGLKTNLSQIFVRNSIDLRCERHLEIFETKKIIPEFCFSCVKVQVDVSTVLDLVRLSSLFYGLELKRRLYKKVYD